MDMLRISGWAWIVALTFDAWLIITDDGRPGRNRAVDAFGRAALIGWIVMALGVL